MIDQSYSERQLFEKAYDRLLTEFQIVMGNTLEEAQKKLDKALKRNLEAQAPKIVIKPENSAQSLGVFAIEFSETGDDLKQLKSQMICEISDRQIYQIKQKLSDSELVWEILTSFLTCCRTLGRLRSPGTP